MLRILKFALATLFALAVAGLAFTMPAQAAAGAKMVNYQYQAQPNSFWCAPAAVRMAWSVVGTAPSQGEIAAKMGTTEDGTNDIGIVARALSSGGIGAYKATMVPQADKVQIANFQKDVVHTIDAGRAVVVNVAGSGVDTAGNVHSFPGHYVTVVGYETGGSVVTVGDSADPAIARYTMSVAQLADWMAPKGYASVQ